MQLTLGITLGIAHFDLRGIDIAAPDFSNVTEPDLCRPRACGHVAACSPAYGQRAQSLQIIELTLNSDLHVIERRSDDARTLDCVLRIDLCNHAIEINAQLRQPLLRDF